MKTKPNILLITADQFRADALGCHGNRVCRTPSLDRLAASGVLFQNGYTPNPICVPARAAITTGNYSHRCTDSKNNDGRIGDDQVKLAEHFASAGYATYACGKLHYVPYSPPGQPRLLHGFQHCDLAESGRVVGQYDPAGRLRGVEDYHDYLADVGWRGYSRSHGIGNNDVRPCASPLPAEHHVEHWVADRAIQRLAQHQADRPDQPFLIWASFPKPHSPYDPPHDWANLYDPRDVDPPIGDESLLGDRNPEIEYTRVTHGQTTLSPAARRVIKAYYYALISFHDHQVGRLLDALEQSGQADNTIVIYTADHGDLMGDFGGYFKCNFLEGAAHVPFIVRAPGGPRGVRRRQLVGLQDVLPTLAGLTGCPLPQPVDGLDLTATIRDDHPTRELFYAQCCESPEQMAMVFDGRWKYCYAQWGGVEELYDLQSDPREVTNLTSGPDGPRRAAQWRQTLIQQILHWGDDRLLDADGQLVVSPLDRQAIRKLPISGMGWRWF